jgi:hypothetical protein
MLPLLVPAHYNITFKQMARFDVCGELYLLYKSTDLLYMYVVLF